MEGIIVYVPEGIEPNIGLLSQYFGLNNVIHNFEGGNVRDNTLYISKKNMPDSINYTDWLYKLFNPDDKWPGKKMRFMLDIEGGKVRFTRLNPDASLDIADKVLASYSHMPTRIAHVYMAAILEGYEPPRYFVPLDRPAD